MKISHLKQKLALTAAYIALVAVWRLLGLPCVVTWLCGIPCPGCGMTRAVLALLRLDVAAAFSYHPMVWSLPILYIYFLSDNGIFRRRAADTALLVAIGVGFLAHWIIGVLRVFC